MTEYQKYKIPYTDTMSDSILSISSVSNNNIFTVLSKNTESTTQTTTGTFYWCLPQPESLSFDLSPQWRSMDESQLAEYIAQNGGNASILKTAEAAGQNLYKSLSENLSGQAEELIAIGENFARQTSYKNKALLFDEMGLGEFDLEFSIIPLDASEMEYHKEKYLALNLLTLPSRADSVAGYKYPDLFNVAIYVNYGNNSLIKFYQRQALAITNISFNMNSDGELVFHNYDQPTTMSLQLSFKETKLNTRGVDNGIVLFSEKFK